ncbi:MAG TPA: M14 family zinc carboxypeptidase [Gaiellaceae bacterium]
MRARRIAAVAIAAVLLAAPAVAAGGPGNGVSRRTVLLGYSVNGRPIVAIETGDFASTRKVLVVGCIHGTECAGIVVARRLSRIAPPPGLDLWIVPDLNPDGHALFRRGNAHRVDLNRNFPWLWQPLKGFFKSGNAPLSAHEARIAYHLILRLRPSVSIWFHQHADTVDDSQGDVTLEYTFAATAGLPMGPLVQEPGSAVTWANHCLPAASAFVVELPAGRVDRPFEYRLAHAVIAAARAAPPGRPTLDPSCAPRAAEHR